MENGFTKEYALERLEWKKDTRRYASWWQECKCSHDSRSRPSPRCYHARWRGQALTSGTTNGIFLRMHTICIQTRDEHACSQQPADDFSVDSIAPTHPRIPDMVNITVATYIGVACIIVQTCAGKSNGLSTLQWQRDRAQRTKPENFVWRFGGTSCMYPQNIPAHTDTDTRPRCVWNTTTKYYTHQTPDIDRDERNRRLGNIIPRIVYAIICPPFVWQRLSLFFMLCPSHFQHSLARSLAIHVGYHSICLRLCLP